MTRKGRGWVAVAGSVAIVGVATMLSAYTGAQSAVGSLRSDTVGSDQPGSGSAAAGRWGYSAASSSQGYSPVQPVRFPHPTHVQTLKMNCVYCHFAANKSPDPGLPAVGTCMGCHTVIGPDRPAANGRPARRSAEIAKLTDYWNKKLPVPWVRIHKVPEYVHFPHMRHVNAGVTCQTCHGQVQKMPQVYQYASLNMGWCITCHVDGYSAADGMRAAGYTPTPVDLAAPRKKARYDCSVCHY